MNGNGGARWNPKNAPSSSGVSQVIAVGRECLPGRGGRVEDRACEHGPRSVRRADGLQSELQRGDSPEVAAAAAQRPQQVRMLVLADADEVTVGRDGLRAYEVIAGEPVRTVEMAESAAQDEPRDADARDDRPRCGQSDLARGAVDIRPGRPASDPRHPARGVHLDGAHGRQVDHQPTVVDGEAVDVVAAGPDRQRYVVRTGEQDSGADVVGISAADDRRRPPVDARIVHRAGLLVCGIVGTENGATDPLSELSEVCDGRGVRGEPFCHGRPPDCSGPGHCHPAHPRGAETGGRR